MLFDWRMNMCVHVQVPLADVDVHILARQLHEKRTERRSWDRSQNMSTLVTAMISTKATWMVTNLPKSIWGI